MGSLRFRPSLLVVAGLATGLVAATPAGAHAGLDDQMADLTRRIERAPGGADLYLERGELHRFRRDWAAALADYRRARALDREMDAVDLCLGTMLLEAGRPRQGLAALERFLARRPDHAEARALRGRALLALGQRVAASEEYSRSIALHGASDPPRPELYVERARALAPLGGAYLDEAIRGLDEGLARLGDPVALQLEAIDLDLRRKAYDAALERLDRIATRSERKEPWLERRVEILDLAGREEEARLAWAQSVAAATGPVARVTGSLVAPGGGAAGQQEGTTPTVLLRGPYLQRGTPDSVTVRWRTDVPTESVVRFGEKPDGLTEEAGSPEATREHVVELSGLAAATRYYYAVGTAETTLAGGDEDHAFVTSPEPGSARPTRIWVLGDSGTADAGARAVRDAYRTFAADGRTDLWLMLGDNAYYDGTDAEYQAAVFDVYPDMLAGSVLWPTLGNHDGHTADSATQSGPYYDIFTLPTAGEAGGLPSGTEAYYSFDYGNIHFICLESHETDRSPGSAMMTWLAADARATARDWVIAFWHHPPYSRGSHDSDYENELVEMRENALPILEGAGVDLVLAGHSHSYERSFLLDGHYGSSWTLAPEMKKDAGDGDEAGDGAYRKPGPGPTPHEGAVYVVAGSSGQTSGGWLDHPAMFVSLNSLGSLVLDVEGERLDGTFLLADGSIADRFTLLKARPNSPPVAAARAPSAVECSSPAGAPVMLDGSSSTDLDSTAGTNDDIASFEWFEDLGLASQALLGTGAELAITLPVGSHSIALRVTDRQGETDTDAIVMEVVDTVPPTLSAELTPAMLWPPDHRMVPIRASVAAADACGDVVVVLSSVTSSEADDASGVGDGRTVGDIGDAEPGTPDLDLELRAERDGAGPGRVYTVVYVATDEAGHTTTTPSAVIVPHDAAR